MKQKLPALLSLLLLFVFAALLLSYSKSPESPPLQNPALVSSESMSRAGDTAKIKEMPFAGARMTRSWRVLLQRAREEGWQGSLNGSVSGVRTRAEQGKLYQAFLAGVGAPAFRPEGPSRHLQQNVWRGEWRQAVDVSRPGELLAAADRMGVPLYQPYSSEPWHIEARGPFAVPSAGNLPDLAKQRPGLWIWVVLGAALFLALTVHERALRICLCSAVAMGALLAALHFYLGAVFLLIALLLLAPWALLHKKLHFPVFSKGTFYLRSK